MDMEKIEKEIPTITYEMEKMNEEIIFLRHEVAEFWWAHNGWKFKDKDKFSIFKIVRETYKALPNCFRNGQTSEQILTENFLGHRKARDESHTHA